MPTRELASPDLHETIRALRSRKWGIVLVVVLVVGIAMAFAVRQTPSYRSTAEVLVEPIQNPLNPYAAPQAPNLDTERQLVQSQTVASLVQASTSIRPLDGELEVSVLADTDVLSISYTDPSPARAAAMANAFANAYLRYRTSQAVSKLNAAAAAVNRSIEDTQAKLRQISTRIATLNQQIDAATKAGQASTAATDMDLLTTFTTTRQSLIGRLGVLQAEYQSLAPNAAVRQGTGEIVQMAAVATSPASPNLPRTAAMALVAGLALGVGLAMLRERLDDRVRGRDELEQRLGAPVVAAIPRVAGWRRNAEPQLVMVTDAKSPVAEAYRTLATNVQYIASQRPLGMILITSATGGEGKTTTASNLAVALAQTGRRVILVSADMRRPRAHLFFGIENRQGLSSLLTGAATLPEVAVPTGIRNLRFIPAGPTPENPAGLLGGRKAAEFLSTVPGVADFVLLDAPPALAVADASVLAPRVDGTLYVIHAEHSGRSAIHQARSQLENAGATIVGGVYNDFDPSKADSYAYYHTYYYAYYGVDQKRHEERGPKNGTPRRRGRGRRDRAVGFESALTGSAEGRSESQPSDVLVGTRGTARNGDSADTGNGHHGGGNGAHADGDTPIPGDNGLPLWWSSPAPGPS